MWHASEEPDAVAVDEASILLAEAVCICRRGQRARSTLTRLASPGATCTEKTQKGSVESKAGANLKTAGTLCSPTHTQIHWQRTEFSLTQSN